MVTFTKSIFLVFLLLLLVFLSWLTPPPPDIQAVTCADFATQDAAQTFYDYHFAVLNDPFRFDADRDGIACEGKPNSL